MDKAGASRSAPPTSRRRLRPEHLHWPCAAGSRPPSLDRPAASLPFQVTKKQDVAGLPQAALELAAQQARDRQNIRNATAAAGPWLFSLDYVSYYPVVAYGKNRRGLQDCPVPSCLGVVCARAVYPRVVAAPKSARPLAPPHPSCCRCHMALLCRALRELLFRARSSQATESFLGGKYDNTGTILDILRLRASKAHILGFPSFADLSMQTKVRLRGATMQVALQAAQHGFQARCSCKLRRFRRNA